MLGYKYGFEPIHEEAAVLFTDQTPDPFEEFFRISNFFIGNEIFTKIFIDG